MQAIATDREALDFLAGRIAEEAKREGDPLSEIERKMLYFSETDWTLPDIAAVSDEFNEKYDEDEYERKIAALIRRIEAQGHSGNTEEREAWNASVNQLSNGDHYIQIMLDSSFSPVGPIVRPPHNRLKLWLTALGIVVGFFGLVALVNWLFGSDVADMVFGRNGLGVLVVLIALIWAFRSGLRNIFRALFHKW